MSPNGWAPTLPRLPGPDRSARWAQGVAINPAYLSTEGKVWLQFKSLDGKPVFGDMDRRRELMRRSAEVNGVP